MAYNPNNPNGQATMANSAPVVVAVDQSAIPISAAVLPLPTGAATSALQPAINIDGGALAHITNFPASATDNTILDTQTVVATGIGNTYTTPGFAKLSFSFAGLWDGALRIEGSNDNVVWFPLLAQNVTDSGAVDEILSAGLYTVTVSTVYMRYVVTNIAGSMSVVVIGKTTPEEVTKLLNQSFDSTTGVNINANIAAGIKKDSQNAINLSDAPLPINLSGGVGTIIIIDTTGYQTLSITTSTMTAALTAGNDGISFAILPGINTALIGTVASSITAAGGNYTFPCVARYIKLVISVAGNAVGYLRNVPFSTAWTSTPYVAGGLAVSAGVVGVQSVGGNVAVGLAPTTNPLVAGGIDGGGLTRRILVDTGGRIATSAADQSGVVRANQTLSPAMGIQNISMQPVQDLSQFEGQSQIEILAQILLEMRLNNYYLYNLPNLINAGTSFQLGEEPTYLRQDTLTLDS